MTRLGLASLSFLTLISVPRIALAVGSAEVYTNASYGYGRMEARIRFAAGDGIISSFFLWKNGSEVSGTFWNELDFEKLGADCHVQTNAIYGNPSANHNQTATVADACGGYHTYAYEWTPEAIVWSVDGAEIRRDTGVTATAFADNAATAGMQARFNIWPGDASFGGNFNPAVLPVHEYIDWVQFSSYQNGAFTMQWREDFNGTTLPSGWLAGNWGSPKNLSTHNARNANIIDGFLVLSLTADDALGPAGAMPGSSGGAGGSGSGGTGVVAGSGGSVGTGGDGGGAAGASSGGTGNGTSTGGAVSSGGSVSGSGSGAVSSGGSGGTDPGGSDPDESDSSDDAGGCALGASRTNRSSALFHAVGLAAILVAARRRFRKTTS